MKAVQINDHVYWVGALDFNVRDFHGYLTPMGSSYNAYLIVDDEITLIDSVKEAFHDDLIAAITEVVDPTKIDNIIVNHVEPDHAGSLAIIAGLAKGAKLFCTKNALKPIKSYYGLPEERFTVVKPGDSIKTGKYSFHFQPVPMVHWPDSMVTYCPELKTLFSNDAFGQHIACEKRFVSDIEKELLFERVADYYANIILPFEMPVKAALKAVETLDIEMICPAHGLIWNGMIDEIVATYHRFCNNEANENECTIVYDTMWGATEKVAFLLKEKFEAEGKTVHLFNLKHSHISQAMCKVITSKTIAVGASTLNRNMLPRVAAFMTYMKGLNPKKRVGLAFGSYGWSGESVGQIEEIMKQMGFEMLPQIKINYMDLPEM